MFGNLFKLGGGRVASDTAVDEHMTLFLAAN